MLVIYLSPKHYLQYWYQLLYKEMIRNDMKYMFLRNVRNVQPYHICSCDMWDTIPSYPQIFPNLTKAPSREQGGLARAARAGKLWGCCSEVVLPSHHRLKHIPENEQIELELAERFSAVTLVLA